MGGEPGRGGFAYRDGKVVRFKKGIKEVGEMIKAARELPAPFVLHFRIATVGHGDILRVKGRGYLMDTPEGLAWLRELEQREDHPEVMIIAYI